MTETARREMTEAGFWTACASELQKHWPDTSLEITDIWMREFIGVPFGTAGYDWSREAATDIAACCGCEFGESHD